MTNEQIIWMMVGAIVSAFAKLVIEKWFGDIIPDRKVALTYIKKASAFALAYVFPTVSIILLIAFTKVVDNVSVPKTQTV